MSEEEFRKMVIEQFEMINGKLDALASHVSEVKDDTSDIRKNMLTDRAFSDNYAEYIRELDAKVANLDERVSRLERPQ